MYSTYDWADTAYTYDKLDGSMDDFAHLKKSWLDKKMYALLIFISCLEYAEFVHHNRNAKSWMSWNRTDRPSVTFAVELPVSQIHILRNQENEQIPFSLTTVIIRNQTQDFSPPPPLLI